MFSPVTVDHCLGAYDTTHATSYWLFYHLAKHQDVQERLKKHIRKVVGSRTDATLEEAREIEYLQGMIPPLFGISLGLYSLTYCFIAVIYESMRLKTTVPINQRINYEEDIQIGEYTIPKVRMFAKTANHHNSIPRGPRSFSLCASQCATVNTLETTWMSLDPRGSCQTTRIMRKPSMHGARLDFTRKTMTM